MTIAAFAPSNVLARPSIRENAISKSLPAAQSSQFRTPLSGNSRLNHVMAAETNGSGQSGGENGDKPNRPLIRIPVEKIQSLREHVLDAFGPKLDEIKDKIGGLQDDIDEQRHCVEQEIDKWEGAARESGDRVLHTLDPVKDVANESIDKVKEHLPKSSELAENSAKNLAEGKLGKAYTSFLGAAGARMLEGALKNVGSKKPDQTPPADDASGNDPVEDGPEEKLSLPADEASPRDRKA